MHVVRTAPVLASVMLLLSSCAGTVRYVPTRTVPGDCGETHDLTVLTYNAGIAPGIVSYASARAPKVAEALGSADADIMCVQELWTDASVDAVRGSLALPEDRFFTVDTGGEGETGNDVCPQGAMDGIAECARERCAGLPDEELTICALEKCGRHGVGLYLFHRGCLNCLVASVGMGLDDIRRRCTTTGASRVYGGNNGVVLASRWPLTRREAVRLPSSGANRVALFATVEVPGKGAVEVACTHLSSGGPVSPTHPSFSSWDVEKRTQLLIVSQKLRSRSRDSPHILLGDMNFSPAIGTSITDTSGQVWRRALSEGFRSPAADTVPPTCSSCAGNTLRGGSRHSYLIDHVLLRDGRRAGLGAVCIGRGFDDLVEIAPYGRTVRTHRSDHYAIRAGLRFRVPPSER